MEFGSIAIGSHAGSDTVGSHGIAIGSDAQARGNSDVTLGSGAGSSNAYAASIGYRNICIGEDAGYGADFLPAACINSTLLGYRTSVTGSNQVQLGNSSTTTYAYGAVQNRSDQRDKTDILPTELGLNFINALNPVSFKWDYREDYREDKDQVFASITKDGSLKRTRNHQGLIAQEVKGVMDALGVDFGGYQDHSLVGGTDVKSLGYEEFIAPLIKAIQELSARVEELENVV